MPTSALGRSGLFYFALPNYCATARFKWTEQVKLEKLAFRLTVSVWASGSYDIVFVGSWNRGITR
ncbi:hypothetical protein NDI45_12455 [Leptolyngbya sp. GB1-A1]